MQKFSLPPLFFIILKNYREKLIIGKQRADGEKMGKMYYLPVKAIQVVVKSLPIKVRTDILQSMQEYWSSTDNLEGTVTFGKDNSSLEFSVWKAGKGPKVLPIAHVTLGVQVYEDGEVGMDYRQDLVHHHFGTSGGDQFTQQEAERTIHQLVKILENHYRSRR